eukprot:TRINITY_DN38244_c0_g1_i1.p2 TRINITY_DN38244_c0_g1~~TRINITY_DN38244_c0_g1_i1.p2  ORF type:complete len:103 (+),score=5.38 TRINITY_DN38244_c0_g1_i1:401-709(+)
MDSRVSGALGRRQHDESSVTYVFDFIILQLHICKAPVADWGTVYQLDNGVHRYVGMANDKRKQSGTHGLLCRYSEHMRELAAEYEKRSSAERARERYRIFAR